MDILSGDQHRLFIDLRWNGMSTASSNNILHSSLPEGSHVLNDDGIHLALTKENHLVQSMVNSDDTYRPAIPVFRTAATAPRVAEILNAKTAFSCGWVLTASSVAI